MYMGYGSLFIYVTQVISDASFIGKGVDIWDTETHKHPDFISDFSNGDVAADSYHKYTEDIQLLKDLGVSIHSL
jgi:beta-glucosidase/6-phospho-beta-glucosidase/beta-galactosidase